MTPGSRGALLALHDVHKAFGGASALRGVSLELRPGEIHALVGENGAGKSTLLRIVTGALRADSGRVEIDGRVVEDASPRGMRALGVVAIYQQPALFPDLTVAENMAIGLEPWGLWRLVDWGRRRRRARELLARLDAPIDVDALASGLGMADQQTVAIARALGADARILLMDEPTAALSRPEAMRLFAVMRELRAKGVGLVYVSHRLEEIADLADRVTVLRDGAVVATRPMAEASPEDVIRLMVGRELRPAGPRRARRLGEVALQAEDLGCRAEGIGDVSFQVRSGEVLGLAGLVGAGRTELARVLFGLSPADRGVIRVKGAPVRITAAAEAVRLGLAYLPEDRRRHGVIPEMSVAANVTLACLRALTRRGFLDRRGERRLAGGFVERLGIKTPSVFRGAEVNSSPLSSWGGRPAPPDPPSVDAAVATLSGGNQQKVALARWLATRPAVLVLDEPTQGVDVAGKAEIHELIEALASEGVAVLLISSDLPEILGLSDRVAIMRAGTVVGALDGATATPEAVMALALGPAGGVAAPSDGARGRRGPVATHRRELAVAAAYGVLLLSLAAFAPAFYAPSNVRDVLMSAAPLLVAATGMTLLILARQIDISIGSQFAVCAVVAGLLAKLGLAMPLVALAAVAAGAAVGALNGLLVAGCGLPSIVVTLATMVGLREALRWATEGVWVQDLPPHFQWLGAGQDAARVAIPALALAVWALARWALRRVAWGRAVQATGSDLEAARLAGMRPRRVIFGVFVLMGALTGLAALLSVIQFIDVQTNSGVGFELRVIAAVVVGGTSIAGGRGSLAGSLLGVLLLATAGPALTFLGSEAHWDRALQGAIILLAVAVAAPRGAVRRAGGP